MKKFIVIAGALFCAVSVQAQDTPTLKPLKAAQLQGIYAGTFLCSSGEMGMTLTLKDIGGTIMLTAKVLMLTSA